MYVCIYVCVSVIFKKRFLAHMREEKAEKYAYTHPNTNITRTDFPNRPSALSQYCLNKKKPFASYSPFFCAQFTRHCAKKSIPYNLFKKQKIVNSEKVYFW